MRKGFKMKRDMDVQDLTEVALAHFRQGFACSQAVLLTFAPEFEVPADLASRIAAPFGGGMARLGETCGAVTGAMMVLGLQAGNTTAEDKTAKEATYALVNHFAAQFKARHGSLLCRELLGCDLSRPDELQQAREARLFDTCCPRFVQDAVELVAFLRQEPPQES
jgi:C_GCAxxG_C_C family probable redox protein